MRGGVVAAVGSRRSYGLVKYEMVVAVVGLRLRRIELLMGSERRVYGPVVAWQRGWFVGDVRRSLVWQEPELCY